MARFVVDRSPRRDDDRGSLAMAMMAVLVGAMLGALILPMVISQNKSTRFDITRVHSLHAAQTGTDVLLGKIKSSVKTVNGNTMGDPSKLMCELNGNTNDGGTYEVSVVYWRDSPSAGPGSEMKCRTGYGTYATDSTGAPVSTPRYAVITSTGRDATIDSGSRGRTVVSTYVLDTADTNLPGGQLRLKTGASRPRWCMDAGSVVPTSGTPVVLRECSISTPPLAQQVFAYRGDLSIQLVSSVTAATPNGLCLDTLGAPPPAHAVGQEIVVKTCDKADPADLEECPNIYECSTWSQQWSIDDSSRLQGATPTRSNIDTFCITADELKDGEPLKINGCDSGNRIWSPSPNAGAGMSGPTNEQLVNFLQFATCLVVTQADPVRYPFLIMYPCKQNPNPQFIRGNQQFEPTPALGDAPTKVLLKTKLDDGTVYCLTSPQAAGELVTVAKPCQADASDPSTSRWTMYQADADSSGTALPYAQKYTIVDDKGLCLAPGTEKYDDQYLKVIVKKCDGSTAQKWNAEARLNAAARVTNTFERPAPTPAPTPTPTPAPTP